MRAFNPVSVIEKKRDGCILGDAEIVDFISGYSTGQIPDYQMAALAMAIVLQGMNGQETTALTRAMLESGDRLLFPDDERPIVDKHSTGGIGDKASMIVAPLLACFGCRVPMLSGRALGKTGGTLDKLESIPGFRTRLDDTEIIKIVQKVGAVICGATERIVPADAKLYALRDVTGTVGSIALITASILSKKLATGPQALLFDVKCGKGAIMEKLTDARALARSLVNTSQCMGTPARAVITDMNQPLGHTVGNAVEIEEVIRAMRTGDPPDLVDLCVTLAGELLALVGRAQPEHELRAALTDGRALARFEAMVAAQGGNLRAVPKPAWTRVYAAIDGYISTIDGGAIGRLLTDMGAGRARQGESIDHEAGIRVDVKIGDVVAKGDIIAAVNHKAANRYVDRLQDFIGISPQSTPPLPLVLEVVT